MSLGYIERRALTYAALRGLAARAALDVSLYDQQGCLSPHAFYVERRGEVAPAKFAEVLATALEARAHDLPRGIVAAEEAASVQLFRAQARFEAAGAAGMSSGAGMSSVAMSARTAGMLLGGSVPSRGSAPSRGATRVLESPGATTWTVVLEDRARFEPGPAHRTVRVHVVDGPEEVARALQSSIRYVEAIGLEARGPERVRLAALFTALGVPRIAPVGQLQRPSPLGTHGGVRRLLPFVTWSSVERAAAHAKPAAPIARRRSPRRAPKRRR